MTDFSISLLMDALVLLRNSFTIPKLQYLLRTSPCFLSASLQCYDNILRSIVTSVTNTRLENNDPAWLQATLPVKMGGLEIRSAVQVDLLAFLASSHVSSDLVSTILLPRFHSLSASLCDEAGHRATICQHLRGQVPISRSHGTSLEHVSLLSTSL